ncbi:MAG: TolB family protein [bacterium]
MKNILIITMITTLPLFAQDFLEGVRAEDLVLDRIEEVPAELAKEIDDEGFDYWFGKTQFTVYSPDSSLIAEIVNRGEDFGILLKKRFIKGGYDIKLSSDSKFLSFSMWSPTKELFHGRQVYGYGGTYIYSNETDELKPAPPFDISACWSPKENYLAGKSLKSECPTKDFWVLSIFDAESNKVRVLDSTLFFEPWNFSWSPNGQMLAYIIATKASGHVQLSPLASEVFIINKDGTGKTQITNTPEPEILVRWLPDGKSLVVERFKEAPDSITGGGDTEYVILRLRKKVAK